jgi:murein DD-endopeptidase MepM/ murein hydrolase activator NlpD
MILYSRSFFVSSFISAVALFSALPAMKPAAAVSGCPAPALSRIQRHIVSRGETLESIAASYNVAPTTISAMNSSVINGVVTIGTELQIPPLNGMVVEVPRGQNWRQVAVKYKVRPDTLFEVNGCQKDPRVVFVPVIPGTTGSPKSLISTSSTFNQPQTVDISGYPLANSASLGLGYGWQIQPTTGDVFFHSGIDLLAPVGTVVEAIAPGVVVFAKEQGTYGKVVIINHAGGYQSRYAQLDSINVELGQQISKGDILGTVGTTGQPTSSQPHLHFEIRASGSLGWEAKDPKAYLSK